ncbi:MAG: DegV family protein [Clostridia bacterium]|nr:DegV family protein [Clostridia bacterium]
MKIKITSDSTCDLSPELVQKFDIGVVPLSVAFGEDIRKDGVSAVPEDIYDFVARTGTLPKTSAVNVEEYTDFFRPWREQGYEVVHFNISALFSSSHQNACVAAEELGGVHVVDSRNLSTGQGLLVLHAAELARQGLSAAEIAQACRKLAPKVEASFVIDSLEYLHKGGRCSALARFGANLMKLKPCIEVRDGAMEPGKKYRGAIDSVILDYIRDRLSGREDIDPHRVFVTHTCRERETVEAAKRLVQELAPYFDEVLETTAGLTVTTHCGPDTLGVLFMRK